MNNRNIEIANRLKEIGYSFGGLTAFARKLGILPQSLNNYWTGKNIPGNKLLFKMKQIGIDVNYIIDGVRNNTSSVGDIGDYQHYNNSHKDMILQLTLDRLDMLEKQQKFLLEENAKLKSQLLDLERTKNKSI